MAAATPCYSSDGKSLVSAASPSVKIVDDYEKQIAALSKRQIEIYRDGKTIPLTDDGTYYLLPMSILVVLFLYFIKVKEIIILKIKFQEG
ncbi:MAG: hypothetical protein NUV45_02220 [Tepidanaerobacteraceae bacterium]|jgi:hypothetical protein|nr:hypothetical protein [Tepidanaerobacteraceae bacterium]